MPIQIRVQNDGTCLVHVSGKLVSADYAHITAEFERLVEQHGRMRVLFEMCDFHGWDAGALWEEIKFDTRHFGDIERLACVGNRNWEKWLTEFCIPFTKAAIRYFGCAEEATARTWLAASDDSPATLTTDPPVKAPLQLA